MRDWRATAALLILLAAGAGAGGCRGRDTAEKSKAATRRLPAEQPVPVRIERIRRGSIETALRYPGELKAPEEVEIAAEISGRIEAIKVQMGQRVRAGDLLVMIDDAQLRSQLQEARAALQVARSSQKRAAVEDRNAATELARKAPLVERDLITRQEMDNVRTRRESAAASLAVAHAQVSQAEARVSLLGKQLRDTRIRAPFGGSVQSRHLDAGAVVTAGKAILRLVRTHPIVAHFRVGERQIGTIRHRMREGTLTFQLGVDAYPKRVFEGRVARVAPALDAASRTVAAEGELENERGLLMPGMFCRIELPLGLRKDVLLLPLAALVERGGDGDDRTRWAGARATGAPRGEVFVVHQGTARIAEVYLGGSDDRRVEVLRGLQAGTTVIVEGHDKLTGGQPVEVVGHGEPASDEQRREDPARGPGVDEQQRGEKGVRGPGSAAAGEQRR